jgi:hypothetical protein
MANVLTPEFRVSYPSVFQAKKNDLSGKDEYSVVALFPKGTDLSKLKAEAQRAVEDKWGKDKAKWPNPLKSPFRDQGERAKNVDGKEVLPAGHEKGAIFITLKSAYRPGVVDQKVQPIIEPSEFYAGCYAIASVRAYTYENKGNKGVAFGLQNIQKSKDGDPLSGKARPEEEFAAIEGAGDGSMSSGITANSLFN